KNWLWDFGDGTTSTDQSPKHTYTQTGTYTVKLTVSNGSCSSNRSQIIHIIDEQPAIKANPTTICAGDSVIFNVTSPIHTDVVALLRWEWGDGSSTPLAPAAFDPAANYAHIYRTPGTYTARLVLEDINGCPQYSNSIQVTANGVTPDFTFDGACKEKPFTFTDASSTTSAGPLTTWVWNFGDGSPLDTLTQQPSGYSHTFNAMATYRVTLSVTDQQGCKGSITKPVSVNVVAANIVVPGQEACLQKDFKFSSNSTGQSLTYDWSFGDGGTSTEAGPLYTYTKAGVYTIKLTVTDIDGCKASQEALNFITVRDPKAVFNFPATLPPCPPVLVPFTNTSTDYDHVAWQFGDGSTSPEVSPGHAYSRPGNYKVILKVYTEGGCFDTTSQSLTIQGPDGTQSATPTTGCMPLKIDMTATSTNAVKYIWDFDDGHVVTTTTPTTSYEYTKEGIYHPRVILEDSKGCQVPALGDDQIVADKVTPGFTIDATQACDGGFVSFTDNSKSVTKDQLNLPLTYKWDFGVDGRTDDVSTDANPRFSYDQVGTYPVKLQVTTAYGCTGEVTLPAVVPPKPQAEITPVAPVCVGTSVRLQGSDAKQLPGTKWSWSITPGGQVIEGADPQPITMNTPGNNLVVLTITNGDGSCPDTAGTVVEVAPIPDLQPMPQDAHLCLGQSLELRANASPDAEVTWTDYQISDPRSPNPVITPLKDTTYHVLAENSAGCSREADITVTVTQPFEISSTDAAICNGGQVQLHLSGAPHYKWTPETGLNKTDAADPVAHPTATTTYQVIGYGDDACFTDTALVTVTVNQPPVISLGPDLEVPVGSEIRLQLQASADVTKVEWRPDPTLSCTDCMDPLAQPKNSVTYHVIATNQYNCVAIDELNVKLVCTSGSVFLPNTFTPNNDGQNDLFYIRGRGIKAIKVFRIFNRWGEMVFERSNANIEDASSGWDGRFRGVPLNPDVFVYYAELVCDTNETFVLKGNVTLLR
ncbi:MAG TPA: PKD domain-containing protein, partial [Chitinophaga sp.]|uniref:PKD domain-containing protein n=1 Tax=Chitinophaga sp. TaxID=1869181 RepID=UPI002DBDF819